MKTRLCYLTGPRPPKKWPEIAVGMLAAHTLVFIKLAQLGFWVYSPILSTCWWDDGDAASMGADPSIMRTTNLAILHVSDAVMVMPPFDIVTKNGSVRFPFTGEYVLRSKGKKEFIKTELDSDIEFDEERERALKWGKIIFHDVNKAGTWLRYQEWTEEET